MTNKYLVPVGALVLALGIGGLADAGQRDNRGRDRNGRASQGRTAPRQNEGRAAQPRAGAPSGGRSNAAPPSVAPNQTPRTEQRRGGGSARPPSTPAPRYDTRRPAPAPSDGNRGYAVPRDNYRYNDRYNDRDRYNGRYDQRYRGSNDRYRYTGPPRLIPGARLPRHYYGPGGNFSIYFGVGRGYLYGSPYYGRVYGYVPPRAYGVRAYYGDVRLEVRPRDAAVYVDGYYAGIVDDFDGVFQRLTLEVGPHQIELDAPGLEPQLFDVYVDPARTVAIHTDLYPY